VRYAQALKQEAASNDLNGDSSGLEAQDAEFEGGMVVRLVNATRRKSDNPFVDDSPFGGEAIMTNAHDEAPLLAGAAGSKHRSRAPARSRQEPSDDDSQMLSGEAFGSLPGLSHETAGNLPGLPGKAARDRAAGGPYMSSTMSRQTDLQLEQEGLQLADEPLPQLDGLGEHDEQQSHVLSTDTIAASGEDTLLSYCFLQRPLCHIPYLCGWMHFV
jgi:hypothetical protein